MRIKPAKVLLIIFGGIIVISPLFFLFQIGLLFNLVKMPANDLFRIFMPFYMLLGCCFIALGIFLQKIKWKLIVHLALSFALLVVFILHQYLCLTIIVLPDASLYSDERVLFLFFDTAIISALAIFYLIFILIIGIRLFRLQKPRIIGIKKPRPRIFRNVWFWIATGVIAFVGLSGIGGIFSKIMIDRQENKLKNAEIGYCRDFRTHKFHDVIGIKDLKFAKKLIQDLDDTTESFYWDNYFPIQDGHKIYILGYNQDSTFVIAGIEPEDNRYDGHSYRELWVYKKFISMK